MVPGTVPGVPYLVGQGTKYYPANKKVEFYASCIFFDLSV